VRTKKLYELVVTRRPTGLTLPDVAKQPISAPDQVAQIARELTQDRLQETFLVFHLNTANKVIGYEEIAKGQIDQVRVSPGDVFRAANCIGAKSIVIAHNHPSGDPRPSAADYELTKVLAATGRLMNLPVLDHVVVGEHGSHSMMASGGPGAAALAATVGLITVGMGALALLLRPKRQVA